MTSRSGIVANLPYRAVSRPTPGYGVVVFDVAHDVACRCSLARTHQGGKLGLGVGDVPLSSLCQARRQVPQMVSNSSYILAADLILFSHVAFVAFVVLGLALIWLGKLLHWHWVRNPWFRLAHLLAIGFVVVESWLGVICPLTRWEMALRERAGEAGYAGSFIAHWLDKILYYQAPLWVFTVCYTLFAAIVIASWFWVRPRGFTGTRETG